MHKYGVVAGSRASSTLAVFREDDGCFSGRFIIWLDLKRLRAKVQDRL